MTHRTCYRYEEPVSTSYGQVHLLPRDCPGQVCIRSGVTVDPAPADLREHTDFYGNRFAYFEVTTPHRDLTVTTTSTVQIDGRQTHLSLLTDQPWEDVRPRPGQVETGDAAVFLLDSPLASVTPSLAEYATVSFTPRRPVLSAIIELTERIHDDLVYRPGSTSVRTTADAALAGRSGVCQDFAHLAIAGLRSLGLAARYVSGYLETDPPPGRPRIVGSDVSHAWASLLVPGVGWIDMDPTNRQLVNDRYVTTAWGRDYSDVPPIKGVIFTNGTGHDLEVSVDVARV